MKLKVKAIGVAVAMAVGALSTSAVAVSPYGNATQKGSLLVFPKINVGNGVNTLIQITNDYSQGVSLKCYYQTIDGKARNYSIKHKTDFQINLTGNQTVWWLASGGGGGNVTPPAFSPMADGFFADAGELKCWASTRDLTQEIHWNHLVGTATVFNNDPDAFTYQAYSFQALPLTGVAGTPLGSPGVLNLDGIEYDSCSKKAIGNFFSVTNKWGTRNAETNAVVGRQARVDLVQCDQDLQETYVPPVTKYVFEFWNSNETKYTGSEVCGDSWIEQDLYDFPLAWASNLTTLAAYFRVSAVGQVCVDRGYRAKDGGVMGVLEQRFPTGTAGPLVGNTLHGRGSFNGRILYDVDGGNETKK